jgi:putative transposase
LLPACWRAINAYGVKINYRSYDGEALNPLRRQRSGVTGRKDLWEVHYDPYDVSRVWVRDHWNGSWITLFWKLLHRVAAPFGELAWDHARRGLSEATEAQIADAVAELLTRANHGPRQAGDEATAAKPARRDRRVAARTRAAQPTTTGMAPAPQPAPQAAPQDEPAPAVCERAPGSSSDEHPGRLAKVIPMPIFDPYREAEKRW